MGSQVTGRAGECVDHAGDGDAETPREAERALVRDQTERGRLAEDNTHDRAFIDAVSEAVWYVEYGTVQTYRGSYTEAQWQRAACADESGLRWTRPGAEFDPWHENTSMRGRDAVPDTFARMRRRLRARCDWEVSTP